MSFLDDLGRGALGWSTGGLSEGVRLLNKKGNAVPGAPPPTPPLTAAGVAISPALTKAIGGIGTDAYGKIGSNYDAAKARTGADAAARGMSVGGSTAPGSYAGQRYAAGQGMDEENLEAALGGGLANTSYNDALQEREYNQNLGLAEEAGALNKPNLLDQIFQGIGSVGKPAATYAGMSRGKRSLTSAPATASFDAGSYPGSYSDVG